MKYVLTLVLAACGSTPVDTLHETLDATHASAGALYQALVVVCDERERVIVEGSQDVIALENVRTECDAILEPLLKIVEGTEIVDQAIDIPWVREAL